MIDWRRPFGRRRAIVSEGGLPQPDGASPGGPDETKASAVGHVIAFSQVGRPVWTPRDYASLAREGFGRNPVAYRCVRMIAEAAASTPLVVFVDGRRDDAHPLACRLKRPNAEQSGGELFEALYGALQTAGNAYLEAAGEGDALEFYALRPDRIQVVPGADGWPAAYDYTAGSRTRRLAREADGFSPVLHLKLFNPADDWYGQSPMEAAAFAIDAHNASAAWNKALLDNAARPSGALVFAGDGGRLTQEQFESLKAQMAEAYAGAANAGRPMLLEGGLSWTPMGMTPQDMDFVEGRHAAAREIALAFGAPPQILGIPGDNTYSNFREANAAFWRQTVGPLVRKGAAAMTAWLEPRFPGVTIAPDLDAVPALAGEREALWARLEAASFLTPEERRRMAGVEQ